MSKLTHVDYNEVLKIAYLSLGSAEERQHDDTIEVLRTKGLVVNVDRDSTGNVLGLEIFYS